MRQSIGLSGEIPAFCSAWTVERHSTSANTKVNNFFMQFLELFFYKMFSKIKRFI
jgi:hypothetical protein